MLSKKPKGLFVEIGDFSILSATTSALRGPFVIESLKEFPIPNGWQEFHAHVGGMSGGKTGRYIPAHCAVYPSSRFFRRHTIESIARAKEPQYFQTVIREQYQIEIADYVAAVVGAADGSEFSMERSVTSQKELLIAGARRRDLDDGQATLVDCGVYPETLQLGTLSTLAALMDYMVFEQMERPTLMLEITPENAYLFVLTRQQVDICRAIPYGLNVMFPIIRGELGLKDEESAKKLFYSNTFDFTEMGHTLLRKMLKELQASTGFYEVQTGQAIGQLFVSLLPGNLGWINEVLSRSLGVERIAPDYRSWLGRRGIGTGDSVQPENLDARWFGLFSLMGNFDTTSHAAQET